MDDLDSLVRKAAPRGWGDDPETAQHARQVAQAVADESRERQGSYRFRRLLGGLALGVGIAGFGVTAATAGPTLLAWVGWEPEAMVQRSFDVVEDGAVCQVVARVQPEYRGVSTEEADRRTGEARAFLATYDWDRAVESITPADIDAAFAVEQARRAPLIAEAERDGRDAEAEANGVGVPPTLTKASVASQLMVEKLSAAFEAGGYLRGGTSLELASECSGPNDRAAE